MYFNWIWFDRLHYCRYEISTFLKKSEKLIRHDWLDSGGMRMKVNIDIDNKHEETSITIQAKEWSEELEDILKVIKKKKQHRLFGVDSEDSDQTVLLDPNHIDFIYA